MSLEDVRRELGRAVTQPAEIQSVLLMLAELSGGAKNAYSLAASTYGALVTEEEQDEELQMPGAFVETVGEAPEPIVGGMIPVSSLLIVSARPKSGKTFFMMQLADDIASGGKLLGEWEIQKPGPVVFFAMEGSKYQLKERIQRRSMDKRNPPVYFYTLQRDFSTQAGVDWMIEKVKEIKPAVIVVDTARQAFAIDDWNNASLVQARMKPLVHAVQGKSEKKLENGCSVIVVHHNNKNTMADAGDRISGSNAFQGICDGYIVFGKRTRLDNGDLQVEAECEGRIDMPEKFSWIMDTDTLQIRVCDGKEMATMAASQKQDHLTQNMEKTVAALKELPDSEGTVKEVAAKMGLQFATVNDRMREAAKQGKIVDTGRKRASGAGKPAVVWGLNNYYDLPSIYIDNHNNNSPSRNGSGDGEKDRSFVGKFFGEEEVCGDE